MLEGVVDEERVLETEPVANSEIENYFKETRCSIESLSWWQSLTWSEMTSGSEKVFGLRLGVEVTVGVCVVLRGCARSRRTLCLSLCR